MDSLHFELQFAIRTARRIGALAHAGVRVTATVKSDGTPQTRLDVAGNEVFHRAVRKDWPDDLALGEEDLDEHRTPPAGARVWVCDPFDGTWLLPFGLPYTVVSIALVQDGQPIVGVVHDPHADRTFTATLGAGAWMNGARIAVNEVDQLHGAVLMLPGCNAGGLDVAAMHSEAIRAGADLMTVGSVIADATAVALGFAAGMIYPYTSPWDMAAVALIVTEAGGEVAALDGTLQRYDDRIRGAVVSNGRIHDKLATLVDACRS